MCFRKVYCPFASDCSLDNAYIICKTYGDLGEESAGEQTQNFQSHLQGVPHGGLVLVSLSSTNFVYKLGAIGGLKRMPALLKNNSCNKGIVVLGENIGDKMVAKQRLSKVIWFTYREKLKIAQDINSDVGWGCLPRVGQMVMAQALVRYFISKGKVIDQEQYLRIIEPFLDEAEQTANYSLSMLLKYARWKYAISPGDWFNIGQLSDVLRKIQDEIPLKGSQELKIVFFSQSVIFIDNIMERGHIEPCRCSNKKLLCKICNSKINRNND